MSEEEVIKRRLIIDGDGTGDDRRLNVILKSMIKWVNSSENSPSENQIVLDRILWQVGVCEYSMKRSQILHEKSKKQMENYRDLQDSFQIEIKKIKDCITESKKNLKDAKVWKQNHVMYDLLAQTIDQHPARKETNEKLDGLHAQLAKLEEQRKSLEEKLVLRKKQFEVLSTSANKLRALLEESEEDEPLNNSLIDISNSPEPEPMSE